MIALETLKSEVQVMDKSCLNRLRSTEIEIEKMMFLFREVGTFS